MRRYLAGQSGDDVERLDRALVWRQVVVPPVVITELLSEPSMQAGTRALLERAIVLPLLDGYWERAGEMRADLLRRGLKAKLADSLIAQSCIDHDVPLITYDRDFRHFESAGLRVI